MPPGGHIDPDETPQECAKRECKEETGLDVKIIGDPQDDLFDTCPQEGNMLKKPIAMLLENIPDCPERDEPAHQHMDFLFLARLIDEQQELDHTNEESGDMRWFTKEEVEALDPETEIFGNVKRYISQNLL